tara:strand:+ start:13824 stop:14846 length:1023 start_codon:yes stop_codon:yes gene_type:complete
MKNIVIIGGAGYLGLHLSKFLLKETDASISIISRNLSKNILIRDKRVTFHRSILEVKKKSSVINLAFENTTNFTQIRLQSEKLFNEIKQFDNDVGVNFFIQVSTIVLSEKKIAFEKKSKNDAYIYSKSYQEFLTSKTFIKEQYSIIRSGNILGLNSPWVIKIADKIVYSDPIRSADHSASSNATNIDFLSRNIKNILKNKICGNFNCSELSDYKWNELISLVFLHQQNEIKSFGDNIKNKDKILSLLKQKFIEFALSMQNSPEFHNIINKLVSLPFLPINKNKIREGIKFKSYSAERNRKLYNEFYLFCLSQRVESDFPRDYEEKIFFNELYEHLDELGY